MAESWRATARSDDGVTFDVGPEGSQETREERLDWDALVDLLQAGGVKTATRERLQATRIPPLAFRRGDDGRIQFRQ